MKGLLTLAGELRNMIYSDYFGAYVRTGAPEPNLLYINRQIQVEAAKIAAAIAEPKIRSLAEKQDRLEDRLDDLIATLDHDLPHAEDEDYELVGRIAWRMVEVEDHRLWLERFMKELRAMLEPAMVGA